MRNALLVVDVQRGPAVRGSVRVVTIFFGAVRIQLRTPEGTVLGANGLLQTGNGADEFSWTGPADAYRRVPAAAGDAPVGLSRPSPDNAT